MDSRNQAKISGIYTFGTVFANFQSSGKKDKIENYRIATILSMLILLSPFVVIVIMYRSGFNAYGWKIK